MCPAASTHTPTTTLALAVADGGDAAGGRPGCDAQAVSTPETAAAQSLVSREVAHHADNERRVEPPSGLVLRSALVGVSMLSGVEYASKAVSPAA
jgi:hypothetical protein